MTRPYQKLHLPPKFHEWGEFAAYVDDELITYGTLAQIAEKLDRKVSTLRRYMHGHKKRGDFKVKTVSHRIHLVPMVDTEDDDE